VALNSKHRSRWLSDIISELQRYQSTTKDSPEATHVSQALARLHEAKQKVTEDNKKDD
jgi:hypothetical protein